MIGWKKLFTIFSATGFIILCVLFYFEDKLTLSLRFSGECTFDHPCVQFCTNEGKSNDELFLSFGNSNYSDFWEGDIYSDGEVQIHKTNHHDANYTIKKIYKIVREEPKCIAKEIKNSLEEFSFTSVSNL